MKIKNKWLRAALLVLLVVLLAYSYFQRADAPLPAETGAETLTQVTSAPEDAAPPEESAPPTDSGESEEPIDEDGVYTSKEDVALYLHTYGRLPGNFITKKEAEKAGWPGGSLEPYCPGMCIGGDRFGNHEKKLPTAPGRTWYECDIDTLGASRRGAKRLVYSSDGLIYYTGDHYEHFTQLY